MSQIESKCELRDESEQKTYVAKVLRFEGAQLLDDYGWGPDLLVTAEREKGVAKVLEQRQKNPRVRVPLQALRIGFGWVERPSKLHVTSRNFSENEKFSRSFGKNIKSVRYAAKNLPIKARKFISVTMSEKAREESHVSFPLQ